MASEIIAEQTAEERSDAQLPAAISHDNLEKAAALKRITTALFPLPIDAILAFALDLEARPPVPPPGPSGLASLTRRLDAVDQVEAGRERSGCSRAAPSEGAIGEEAGGDEDRDDGPAETNLPSSVADVEEDAAQDSAENCDDVGLAALVAGLDGYKLRDSDPMAVPGPAAVAEALLFELRRVEMRIAAARDVLAELGFSFDWQEDDTAVDVAVSMEGLDEAAELIDKMRAPLLQWFRYFDGSRLLALKASTTEAVKRLAGLIPGFYFPAAEMVTRAAVKHLETQVDAAAIIAKAEREERLERERETGSDFMTRGRNHWPWVRPGGRPWEEARPAAPTEGEQDRADQCDEDRDGQCVDTDDEDVGSNLMATALAVSVAGQDGREIPGGETVVDVMIPVDRLEEFHRGVAQYALSHARDAMQAELEAVNAGQDGE